MLFRHTAAIALLALLSACGGGSDSAGGEAPNSTTVISGTVSDDPIAGATVTATSLDSGLTLGTAITATDGTFSISTSTAQIGSGYSLRSVGGTMNGAAFLGGLSAIYPIDANSRSANLTLITTALLDAASDTSQTSSSLLQRHELLKRDLISRGIVTSDYSSVEPSGDLMARLRAVAIGSGVSAASTAFKIQISGQPGSTGCGATDVSCTKDIGPLEQISIDFPGGASIRAAAGTITNCHLISSFDAANQTIRIRLENIPSTGNSTSQITCASPGLVTAALPRTSTVVVNACRASQTNAAATQQCVTASAGIVPSFFVDDGYQRHRTNSATYVGTLTPAFTFTLTRDYGSVLYSSLPATGLPANQWAGKTAVVLVHGFSFGGGFGGGSGTWGALPSLITEDSTSIVALDFRWITDSSYKSVAIELAKAINYAYVSTGKKVHIVAHSFGGVLARVLLQNIYGDSDIALAASRVTTLTTVGTPHSGISKTSSTFQNPAVTLPVGWGSWVFDSLCHQISCYQSGLRASVASWALAALADEEGGSLPKEGYINAKLADVGSHHFPTGLKVLALIGQIVNHDLGSARFGSSDGLISYYGQRFLPELSNNALLPSSVPGGLVGGADITEQVLGLADSGNAAFPGTPAGGLLTEYAQRTTSNPLSYCVSVFKTGYKHSSMGPTLATGLSDGCTLNSEVNVPDSCGTAASCQHDTWRALKSFWTQNPAGCVAPNVLQDGFCNPPAIVTSITPNNAIAGSNTVFTVVGTNLPSTAVLRLGSAQCLQPTAQSVTGFSSICTVNLTPGNYLATVQPAAGSSSTIGSATSVTVSAQSRVAFFSDEFDGTALDLSKWTVLTTATSCCRAGTPGAITVSGGVFKISVPGGSNGWSGISDGSILKPVVTPIVGDFEITLSGQEVARQSTDLNPALVVTQLELTAGARRFGVYIKGDALSGSGSIGTAGPSGHRVNSYADGAILPLQLDLPVGSLSRFEFRARRTGSQLYLGFRIQASDAWQEALVPTAVASTEAVTPSISFVSGNGGTVGGQLNASNASFITQMAYFRIER